jgi:RND superfamily putative drug exporter
MTFTDTRPVSTISSAPAARGTVTVRIARSCARHPWRALAAWITFVVLCLVVGSSFGLNAATDLDLGHGQSGRGDKTLHAAGLADPIAEQVLLTGGTAASRQQAALDITTRMRALEEVASVAAPEMSKAGTALLVGVTMAGDPNTASDRLQPLLDATAKTQQVFPGLRVEEVGEASINQGINDNVAKDLSRAGLFSLPITLVILLVAFGAFVAAGIPVLLALSSVGAATGLSMIASQLVPDSGTTSSVILMIGMAVGVDYSLFYLKRAREEQARGATRFEAIEAAARTSGHSVVVSGAAVIVSMAGLFLAGDLTFSSLAVGAILVVAVAVLGSLTVVPALLALLGKKIDRPRVPVLWRLTQGQGEPRFWPAVLSPALKHPRATLVASCAVMLGLAAPALSMHMAASSDASLPRTIPVVRSYDRLTAEFPSQQASNEVVVTAPAAESGRVAAALQTLTPQVRSSKDGTVHAASLDTTSADARASLDALRGHRVGDALKGIPGAQWAVTGGKAVDADFESNMASRLGWVIGFVLGLTFLVMAWTFRSVVVGLTTIAVNALSAAACFGILTLVFQGTWAEGVLGFTSSGTVASWIPLTLFVILFGLSMDYHVFVVSRIREGVQDGLSTTEAVRRGITSSAGVVTSAALVMVSVFAVFASLSMIEMKQFGVGLGVAVLLDALVIRAVVLPAIMALLGRANWWPSHLSAEARSS